MRRFRLIRGDCVEALQAMPADSVDAIVTDPPYGLGFMGKAWDALPPGLPWARECLRVLKPGGHIVAFGGQRTIHRLTCALEDAGFEIRDLVGWLQWQGFPKSLDVGKAIDAAAGVEREVVGSRKQRANSGGAAPMNNAASLVESITAPATDAAKQWDGWGTALKPCIEPATLARKPLQGTVAANVQKWGTGALNIDGCRYAYGDEAWPGPQGDPGGRSVGGYTPSGVFGTARDVLRDTESNDLGRWPANVYATPKASRSEREAGCEHLHRGQRDETRTPGDPGGESPRNRGAQERFNTHPTCKPIALMRWLCRLVTPPDGTVLDTFTGSGTTGIAALAEGFSFVGIEREAEYIEIARARITGDAPLLNREQS